MIELTDSDRAAIAAIMLREPFPSVDLYRAGIAAGLERALAAVEWDGRLVSEGMNGKLVDAYRMAITHSLETIRALKDGP